MGEPLLLKLFGWYSCSRFFSSVLEKSKKINWNTLRQNVPKLSDVEFFFLWTTIFLLWDQKESLKISTYNFTSTNVLTSHPKESCGSRLSTPHRYYWWTKCVEKKGRNYPTGLSANDILNGWSFLETKKNIYYTCFELNHHYFMYVCMCVVYVYLCIQNARAYKYIMHEHSWVWLHW